MRVIVLFSILAALILAAPAARAGGCTCSPNPFENRWNAADAVFTGTVIEIREMHEYIRKGNAKDLPVSVLLRVNDKFRGPEKLTAGGGFELQTSLTVDTCTGHPFEKGKDYLVFAYKRSPEKYDPTSLYNMPSGSYDVGGLCGGTKSMTGEEATAEIAQIRKKIAEEPEEKPKGLFDKMFGN